MIKSQCLKSSSVAVPTEAPMLSGKPTDVPSWHIFALSGKLLCPCKRAKSWNI